MKSLKKNEKIRYHIKPPLVVEPGWSVEKAITYMSKNKARSFLVKENNNFVGIVTESDVIFKVILGELDRKTTPVTEIMTKTILSMDIENTLGECIEFMKGKNIRHLPVTDKNKIVGMMTLMETVI